MTAWFTSTCFANRLAAMFFLHCTKRCAVCEGDRRELPIVTSWPLTSLRFRYFHLFDPLKNTWLARNWHKTPTWNKLSPPSFRCSKPCSFTSSYKNWYQGVIGASLPMFIIWRYDAYHLLPMCPVHTAVRLKLPVWEFLVLYSFSDFCMQLKSGKLFFKIPS